MESSAEQRLIDLPNIENRRWHLMHLGQMCEERGVDHWWEPENNNNRAWLEHHCLRGSTEPFDDKADIKGSEDSGGDIQRLLDIPDARKRHWPLKNLRSMCFERHIFPDDDQGDDREWLESKCLHPPLPKKKKKQKDSLKKYTKAPRKKLPGIKVYDPHAAVDLVYKPRYRRSCDIPSWVQLPDLNTGKFYPVNTVKGEAVLHAIRALWAHEEYVDILDLVKHVPKTTSVTGIQASRRRAFIMAFCGLFVPGGVSCYTFDYVPGLFFRDRDHKFEPTSTSMDLLLSGLSVQRIADTFHQCTSSVYVMPFYIAWTNSLYNYTGAHANALYFNRRNRTWMLFEPHGTKTPHFSKVLEAVESYWLPMLGVYDYHYLPMACPRRNVQAKFPSPTEVGGFCVSWQLWFMIQTLLNPDVDPSIVQQKVILAFERDQGLELIQRFTAFTENMVNIDWVSDRQFDELRCALQKPQWQATEDDDDKEEQVIYLEHPKSFFKSAKFWEIARRGVNVDLRWGKSGRPGRLLHKHFNSVGDATAYLEKQVEIKKKHGYQPV